MARKSIYPPSVQPGIPKLGKLPPGWKLVPFRDLVKISSQPAALEDDKEYQLVTAKRSRGGIVPREKLLGENIKTKTQFYISAGDFLISRRQIVHGACGIVPPELDGSVVSNEYLALHPKEDVMQKYLAFFSHSLYFQQTCFHSSIGVDVEKMVFKVEQWLKHKMLLPPIAEQKRIVEVLEAWDSAIALTEQLITAKKQFKNSLVFKLLLGDLKLSKFSGSKWPVVKIKNIVQINPRLTVKPSADSLITFLGMADVQEGGGLDVSKSLAYKEVGSGYTAFQENDILIAKITPCFENYKGALARNLASGIGFGSTEFHVLRCGEKVKPDFLCQITLSYDFRGRGQSNMIGSAGQKRVPTTFIKNYSIPLPSLEEQAEICDLFHAIDSEILALSGLKRGYELQRQGLLKKLLIGEWRVPGEEVAA